MAKYKPRRPMMVSDDFERKIKELQKKVRLKNGENPSLRALTDDIVKWGYFEELERHLINGDLEMNIKIKMDSRRQR